jgi:hypothetical protein
MSNRLLPLLPLAVPALVGILAPSPAHAAGSIRISVSPNVILADGVSTATVTADVRNSSGRPARDGTEVRFYTTAGSITQLAFTSAGVARATLTASAVPQAANISVSAGVEQAVITVPMVSKLVEANVGGRVLRLEAKYVAFSEDKRYIQADQQVKLTFRGVTVEATSLQVDLNNNTVKALGAGNKVSVASDDKSMVGERLWLDLKTFEGYIVAVGTRKWFSAYGLTDLPEKPKNSNPDFDLVDLTDSKLVWVAQQATYVIDERVQVQGARAYVGGIKSFRMPFHEANLKVGFGDTGQYVGFGTEGISLDIPLYVRMTPGSTTAFNVGYGARSGGVGFFGRERGLRVDLVQKYGFSGASEGEASLTNLNSFDRWGFYWNHTHKIGDKTRLVTNLQFPEHKDLYGHLNLTHGLPIGNLQVAMAANRLHRTGTLAKTLSFAFESKPKPVLDGKFNISASASSFWRDAQTVRVTRGLRVPLQNTQYQTFGLNLRPKSVELGKGFTLDSNLALRAVTGNARVGGFGPAFETNVRKQLGQNGFFSFGLSYNHLAQVNDFLPTSGRLNATMNLSHQVSRRLRIAALATAALDAESRNSLLQASYQLTPSWRIDVLHTLFKYGEFGNTDYQLGIARTFGSRELALYWSRREHRFIIEFGASRF